MASIVPMTVSSILIRWAMIAVSESYSASQKKIRRSSNESKMQSPHTTTRDGRRRQKEVMTSCKTYVNSSHSQLEGTNSRTKTAFLGTWIFTNRFLSNLTFMLLFGQLQHHISPSLVLSLCFPFSAANSDNAIPRLHSTSFPSTHCVNVMSLEEG